MKRLIYVATLIALSGCSTTRYVTVPCVTPEQFEKLKADEPPKVGGTLTGEADKDIRIVGGSAVRLRGYAQGLLGVLEGCRG
jgi:hypothetical protein